MWSRHSYLNDVPEVSAFVSYLARVISGEISVGEFWPGFDQWLGKPRQSAEWGLESLCRNYVWRDASLAECTRELRPLRRALREAIATGVTQARLNAALKGIFDWGMDPASAQSNYQWALDQGDGIVDLYLSAFAELAVEQPTYGIFRTARMNAGYTKVYAIPSLNTIIYDSRVAASFCWLIRRFLLAHPEHALNGLPRSLKFGVPKGKGKSVIRDPSGDGLQFPALGSSKAWASSNVRASWIITAALAEAGPQAWCRGRYAIRRVEAGLFMLGYRIAPANAGAPTEHATRDAATPKVEPRVTRVELPVTFDEAYALLSKEPNASVSLATLTGKPFTASAKISRNRLPKIWFPDNYSVDREYWGANYNRVKQHISRYTLPLAAWAASRIE